MEKITYRDGRYTLGENEGKPFLKANGSVYALSCHPYEPCLYITDGKGCMTAVHNAFDPSSVLDSFGRGETVRSITGLEYDAKNFCRMVEYAANMVDIQIDEAEKVLRAKQNENKNENKKEKTAFPAPKEAFHPEKSQVIEDDPFCSLISEYPDSVVDFCLVRNDRTETGYNAHRKALVRACRKLFVDEEEAIWHYDAGKADAKLISADELFAPVGETLNYRRAFLKPPYGNGYTDADFERINAALFPNGKDALEICEWTTDWSEYFDEGHEWWGALCITAYDKTLDRFAVIMASATD